MSDIDRLVKAWTNEGPFPVYHRRKKKQLRKDWPVLYRAIDELVKKENKRGNKRSNEGA